MSPQAPRSPSPTTCRCRSSASASTRSRPSKPSRRSPTPSPPATATSTPPPPTSMKRRHVRTRGGSGGRRLTCPPRSSGVRDKDAPVRSPMSRCRTGAHRRDRALHGAHQVGDMPRSVPAPWPPGGARLPRRREGAGGRGRGAWRLYESGAPRERSTTATMTRSSARYDCIPHPDVTWIPREQARATTARLTSQKPRAPTGERSEGRGPAPRFDRPPVTERR